jgi:hypothetical protein
MRRKAWAGWMERITRWSTDCATGWTWGRHDAAVEKTGSISSRPEDIGIPLTRTTCR